MRRPKHQVTSGEDLFVGIDLHKHRWHVTIRTFDVEVFSASIAGTWEALHRVLVRYVGHPLQAVYEAGYFGFRLHDRPAWLLLRVWFPRSTATGSKPIGGTVVSWRICWPRGY